MTNTEKSRLGRSDRGKAGLNGLFPLIHVEEVRPRSTVIRDEAGGVHEIEPFRGSAVAVVNRVVHFFDKDREFYIEAQTASRRRFLPFVIALVLAVDYIFLDIYRHLPTVGRVCFLNVHHEELDLAPEPIVNLFYAPNLGAEGRSSVATENEGDRPFATIIGQPDTFVRPQ